MRSYCSDGIRFDRWLDGLLILIKLIQINLVILCVGDFVVLPFGVEIVCYGYGPPPFAILGGGYLGADLGSLELVDAH